MPIIEINNISVDFPFNPYDIQEKYMHTVIEALKSKRCAVLESPTGTGKTVSLLCSTISWVKHFINCAASESDDWNRPKITIFYASRTHSQLSKVMTELNATNYRNLKVTILGSRDQLCIHPKVSAETSLATKNLLCRAHSKAKSCHYGNRVESCSNDPSLSSIIDIEDLVSKCKKLSCCPYYLARELQHDADIVFLPYNYLFDHNIRSNLHINLQNSVVILDEAHNVNKVCEDAASVTIRVKDLALSIAEITEEMSSLVQMYEEQDLPYGQYCSPDEIYTVKKVLEQLEAAFYYLEMKESNCSEGSFIFKFLNMVEINERTYSCYASLFNRTSEMLSVYVKKGIYLKRLAEALAVIFSFSELDKDTLDTCFVLHYQRYIDNKKRLDSSTLYFWCLNPGHGMSKLLNSGVHSVILTSGTLAPIHAFIYELDLEDPIILESPHIIESKQVYINVVTKGPTGFDLKYNYTNRGDQNYWKEIGLCLQNYLRIIPDGVLVFLPSYAMLQKAVEVWTEIGLMSKLSSIKPIFMEPTSKEDLVKVISDYRQAIAEGNSRGAVLLGVCRGKVSEGLDFENELGRAVVIIGLPFPPFYDPKVVFKKQYVDQRNQSTMLMSGDLWYQLEATKAVNQAIGRVIRHSQDFGAILLCDVKFSYKHTLNNLSKWLRPIITQQPFGKSVANLKKFFYINAGRKRPISEPCSSQTVINLTDEPLYDIPQKNCNIIVDLEKDNDQMASASNRLCCRDINSSQPPCADENQRLLKENDKGDIDKSKKFPHSSNMALQPAKKRKIRGKPLSFNITVPDNSPTYSHVVNAKDFLCNLKTILEEESYATFATLMKNYFKNLKFVELIEDLVILFPPTDESYTELFLGCRVFFRGAISKKFIEVCQSYGLNVPNEEDSCKLSPSKSGNFGI